VTAELHEVVSSSGNRQRRHKNTD